jgi:translocation and assembly module TamA
MLLAPHLLFSICYTVDIEGLNDREALKEVRERSELVSLQNRPPASASRLKFRIAADLPKLVEVLRAYGYYDAEISSDLSVEEERAKVLLLIHPGPQYEIGEYEIVEGSDCKNPLKEPLQGLPLGSPALASSLIDAELDLLTQLSEIGYPLAVVDKRRVLVDLKSKKVSAGVCLEKGPEAKFGPTTLFGLKGVHPRFIARKLAWKEGEIYNSDQVEKTTERLLKSDLFSSVFVTHGQTVDSEQELPMKLRLAEAKHQTVSVGVSYGTVDGPGGSVAWTHRNLRGMGETLRFQAEASVRYYAGLIQYRKNDFLRFDQSWTNQFEVSREDIRPYLAFNYRADSYLERRIDEKHTVSIGLTPEYVDVKRSANNGRFPLISLPILIKYSSADTLLDPQKGLTASYQVIPYQSLTQGDVHYVKQRFTGTIYFPIPFVVLAFRLQVGAIGGAAEKKIPIPKLFLGGSEDDLRGYRYMTVSPLSPSGKPLGGRSAIFGTVEPRFKISKTIGFVPFFDYGTVSLHEWPQVDEKWLKSVGFGVRYFTYFGPLRADIGFPLNRRRGIDPRFRIYANIGQTF